MHQESVAVDVKKVRIYAQQISHLIEKEETLGREKVLAEQYMEQEIDRKVP